MYLNDSTILTLCLSVDMIQPFDLQSLQPASYDCHLDNVLKDHYTGETFNVNDRPFVEPGEFVLASTIEEIRVPDYLVAQVWGKSSNGREGLFIQNAGWVDPGFQGQLTLELFNCSKKPFDLRKIKGICQVSFAELNKRADTPYDGHYQNQLGATMSYMQEQVLKGKQ